MTELEIAAYLTALVTAYGIGWKFGRVVHYIKKLGTSA